MCIGGAGEEIAGRIEALDTGAEALCVGMKRETGPVPISSRKSRTSALEEPPCWKAPP
jgi:hypothetical protein